MAVTCIPCHYLEMISKEEYQNYLLKTKEKQIKANSLTHASSLTYFASSQIKANSQTFTGPALDVHISLTD